MYLPRFARPRNTHRVTATRDALYPTQRA
jgi:hypothetical protein